MEEFNRFTPNSSLANYSTQYGNDLTTSLVSQRTSKRDPVPTVTCLPQEHEATMLDNESV